MSRKAFSLLFASVAVWSASVSAEVVYRGTPHIVGSTVPERPEVVEPVAPIVASYASSRLRSGSSPDVVPSVQGGGEGTLSFTLPSSPRTPAWLQIDTSTGQLFGVAEAGSWPSVPVTVRSSDGRTAEASFSIEVIEKLAADLVLPPTIRDGDTVSQAISVTGGEAPFTYAFEGPAVAGLSFDAARGTLSGTAVAGSYPQVKFSVSDGVETFRFAKDILVEERHDFLTSVYGGPSGSTSTVSVARAPDGTSYSIGSAATTGTLGNDALLIKYDAAGTVLWHRVIGSSAADNGRGVAVDRDGNAYITGETRASGGNGGTIKLFVARYSPSGGRDWIRFYSGSESEQGSSIAVSGETVAVGGASASGSVGSWDGFILKLDRGGGEGWRASVGTTNNDSIEAIAVGDDGSVYAGGRVSATTGGPFIVKYNSSGVYQWHRSFRSSTEDGIRAMTVDSTGNIYAAGYLNNMRGFVRSYTSSGGLRWSAESNEVGQIWANSVDTDAFGNVFVSGSQGNGNRAFVSKLDRANGDQLKAFAVSGIGTANAMSVEGDMILTTRSGSSDIGYLKLPLDVEAGARSGKVSVIAPEIQFTVKALADSSLTLDRSKKVTPTLANNITFTHQNVPLAHR